ncbi:4Fe-4S dicluster domain-containing protein [Clostridium hydrogeniformans]|uniref:4Fe-4S dicluster domain-containing protein n=1 Tax=Clostridium hydrogeniformans TaxID=349933 RepID=UPI000483EC4C|nr:4Fe-4S dicluster domain-containing protein [Clostridium hydrogeniformans]
MRFLTLNRAFKEIKSMRIPFKGVKKLDIPVENQEKYLSVASENYDNLDTIILKAIDREPFDETNSVLLSNYRDNLQGIVEKFIKKYDTKISIVLEKGKENLLAKVDKIDVKSISYKDSFLRDEALAFKLGIKEKFKVVELYDFVEEFSDSLEDENLKLLSIGGNHIKNPGVYLVPKGAAVKDILNTLGEDINSIEKVVVNGSLGGKALGSLEERVVKGIKSLTINKEVVYEESPCISCGRCSYICPVKLLPMKLESFVINDDSTGFKEYNGDLCTKCGLCSYICPSRRHIAHRIATGQRK